MSTNDDLDEFFKKKDRKPKKQRPILTNNNELYKQLVNATVLTSVIRENMDLNDDDIQQPIDDEIVHDAGHVAEDNKVFNGNKSSVHNPKSFQEKQLNLGNDDQQQQDDWEDFTNSNSKYNNLRSMLCQKTASDNDDDFSDGENNLNNDEKDGSANDGGVQQKDKPVWKINEVANEPRKFASVAEETVKEPVAAQAYRPPALRAGANQPKTKKKEPNILSTEEFPTLGSTVHKK